MRGHPLKTLGRLAAPLLVALTAGAALAVPAPTSTSAVDLPEVQPVLGVQGQVHYLPWDAAEFLTMARGQNGSVTNSTSPVRLITSIVSALDGNEIAIDHWEDGYDVDPLNAGSVTTEVFTLNEGQNRTLSNAVNTSNLGGTNGRGTNQPWYDGGDKLVSTGALVVSAGGWPSGAGTLHAGAAAVPNVNSYGLDFVAPTGDNVSTFGSLWDYTGVVVVASQDGTNVDVAGTDITLDEGDSHLENGGIQMGETISADKPVAVYLTTGDPEANYEGRLYNLTPTEQLSTSYMTPVGSRSGGANKSRVFLYNPSGSAITVTATPSTGSATSITVPANGQANYLMPDNVGARFTSSSRFNAIEATTTPESGTGNDASSSFNWGISLIPTDALTPMVVVGYGPGSDDFSAPTGVDANDSAVWVAPVATTTLYVDLDADPDSGDAPTTDPNGNHYDFTCAATAGTPVLIKDVGSASCSTISSYSRTSGTGDNDMTGARIYTVDGVSLASAWGQVPGEANAGTPAIDMGTTVLPFPTIDLAKSAEILNDDGDGEAVPGDTLRYTITITNRGISPVDDLVVNDEVPEHTSYVAGSTVANGTGIADPTTGTTFPLDEGGLLVPPVLGVGETRSVVYDLLVDDPLPDGVTEIVNEVVLESDYGDYHDEHETPVAPTGSIGDRLWNDADGDGVQDGGEAGLTGVTVELRDDEDNVVATTTTGANGAYLFDDVWAGTYTVRVVPASLPANVGPTFDLDGIGTANQATFTLAADQDRTDVDFGYVAASITLTKTVYNGHNGGSGCPANANDSVTREVGDPITYCFKVTNTGAIGLVGVTVDDADLGIDQSDMALEAGNPATLAAGQSVTWSYDATATADLVNHATATASLPVGGSSRTAEDTAEVNVIAPAIQLEKTVYEGHDAGAGCGTAGESVTVREGDDLTWCFRVTNTGETALSAVTFSDPDLGVDEGDQVQALLNPGQHHTFRVEGQAAFADLTNTATAVGTSPAGVRPTDEDDASYDTEHPAIGLTKTVYVGHDDGAGCDTAGDDVTVRSGTAVTWCLHIENAGDVDLDDLAIEDLPLLADETDFTLLSGSLGTLAVDGSVDLYLEATASGDVANTATVTATPPTGPDVESTDDADVDVIDPAISVSKTVYAGHDDGAGCEGAGSIEALAGDEVTYCFLVSNDGDVALTDITVDDLDLDDSGLALASGSVTPLGVGQDAVFYLEAVVEGDLDNTVEVTGVPPVGPPVEDDDEATVDEVHPAITLEKAVYGGHDDGAGCDTAGDDHQGEDDTPVTWCFTVTNTGDVTLTDLTVEDLPLDADEADLAVLSGSLDSLDAGDTVVLYLEDTLTDDLVNTATATGTPPVGPDVSDGDVASVELLVPSVEIRKTVYRGHDAGASCEGVENVIARAGDPVTWCLLVTNTGDTDVATTVSDPAIGFSDEVDLAPGHSQLLYVEDTVDGDLTNVAAVSGESPEGHPVEDEDDASVDEVHPSLRLDKTVYLGHDSGASCQGSASVEDEAGQPVTWCFVVTNTGDTTLTDVTLDDADLGVVEGGLTVREGSLASLDPGESVILFLQGTVDGDLTNVATATAVPPVGPDVGDDGEAEVHELVPGIHLEKTVYAGWDQGASCEGGELVVGQQGDEITWCFVVTNTGETHLATTVTDDGIGFSAPVDLDPGESQTVWDEDRIDGDLLPNTATATGETPDGDEVDDPDEAGVDEIHPAIEVEKSVALGHGATCPGQETVPAEVGQAITWCFLVTNTGDVPLTDVTFDDPVLDIDEGDVTVLSGDLALLPVDDELWASYEDTVPGVVHNTVTVTGTAPDDTQVDDADIADVSVIGPEIGIAKSVIAARANGDGTYTVTYRLRVTNTGRTPLHDVQVVDDLRETFRRASGFAVNRVTSDGFDVNWPGYTGRPGGSIELLADGNELAEGQTEDIDVTVTITPGRFLGPYDNTATATGTSPVGDDVTDVSDSGTNADPGNPNTGEPGDSGGTDDPVPVEFPAIDLVISKWVEDTQVEGTTGFADWRIQVGNQGPGDDPGPITVTDHLDDRLSLISVTGDGWDCGAVGQRLTCTWNAPLAAGQLTTEIKVRTSTEITGNETIANAAHVASTGGETRTDNNDSAAEVQSWVEGAPSGSTLPRTGATVGGLVLLGLGLVLGGRLLQRRSRAVA